MPGKTDRVGRLDKIDKTDKTGKSDKTGARKPKFCAEHGRRRNTCVPCGGSGICEHKRRKWVCSLCNGRPVPQHFCKCGSGARAAYCRGCRGSGICPCDRRREECPTCNEAGYFRKVVRRATRRAFVGHGGRSARTEKLLGCTYAEFHRRMGAQIELWNRTYAEPLDVQSAEVDHIKSLKACELDGSDPREVCHYTNLQILPAWLNAVKRATWGAADERRWRERILYRDAVEGVFWPEACPALELPGVEWRSLWVLADAASRCGQA
jgi:hypothetical protein